MSDLLCEDFFIDFVVNREGLAITRKTNNLDDFDYTKQNPIACLAGTPNILRFFFSDLINKFTHPVVVVIIESDIVSLEQLWLMNPRLKHCYTWNKPFSHDKVSCLPIGLNYLRHHNSMESWLKENSASSIGPQCSKLLSVNYSPETNSIRAELAKKALTAWPEFCDVLKYLPAQRFVRRESKIGGVRNVPVINPLCYDRMRQYKFILSPPGVGEDTHRTWESLYVGCIPIVKSSNLNELYKDLPVVVVDDWNVITRPFLEKQYERIQTKLLESEFKMEKLTLEYWLNQIQNSLRVSQS